MTVAHVQNTPMNKDCTPQIHFLQTVGIDGLNVRYSCYRTQAFDRHFHPTYSIGLIEKGLTQYTWGNQVETLHAGHIALINPGEVHACNPQQESELTYFMFYLEPSLIQAVTKEAFKNGEALMYWDRHLLLNPFLYSRFRTICRLMREETNPLAVESLLTETLVELFSICGNFEQEKILSANEVCLKKAYAFITDNLDQHISLQDVSAHCSLSPYHLLRSFRDQYGLPPHTFQNQKRINRARQLLSKGMSIAETAARMGFADQSHFTRKFKRSVGMTPGKYQKLLGCLT